MSTFPTALDTFKDVSANPYMDDGGALATEVIAELQSAIVALQQAVGTTDYAQPGSLRARLIENLGSAYNILMHSLDGDVQGISTVSYNPVTFALETLILATSAVRALSEVAPLALQVGESGTFRELTLSPGAAAPEYNDGAALQYMLHTGNTKTVAGQSINGSGNVVLSDADVPASVNTITATTKTLALTDRGVWQDWTATGAKTLTVDTTVGAATGEYHMFNAAASGDLTIAASGVTITPPKGGTLVLEPGDYATLKRVGTNLFRLVGSTKAA